MIIYQIENILDLHEHTEDIAFYRVSPVTGQRIDGVISVWMDATTSYLTPDTRIRIRIPLVRSSICPSIEKNGNTHGRLPMVINGKTYKTSIQPTASLQPDDSGWRNPLILDGHEYGVATNVACYKSELSDKAQALVRKALQEIARHYVTEERWHNLCLREARKLVTRAAEEHDEARNNLTKTLDNLKAMKSFSEV